MSDGSEHAVAAKRGRVMSGWLEDICRAREFAKSGSDFNMLEVSYVVVDTTDDAASLCSDGNTSWNSSMRNHIARIASEQGLDAQRYQCFDCAAPVGMLYGSARVCHFTGHYYCEQCHLNEEHQIPARMIHNWDFKKHKVSKRSKQFLAEIWREPCIDMERVNPIAYRHLDALRKLLPLRWKLSAIYPYISTCTSSLRSELIAKLKTHYYMVENPHLYTPHDLSKTNDNKLTDALGKALAFAIDHVTTCDLCSNRGHVCEVCRDDKVIFAFQTESTQQCEVCKTVYHKKCLPDILNCRKCERRNRRTKFESPQVIDDF